MSSLFAPIWLYLPLLAPKYHVRPYLAYVALFTYFGPKVTLIYPYFVIFALNYPDLTMCAKFTPARHSSIETAPEPITPVFHGSPQCGRMYSLSVPVLYVATVCPGGATVCPGGATVCPGGATVCPSGATVCPGGATVCPGGATVCPGGAMVCPGGANHINSERVFPTV